MLASFSMDNLSEYSIRMGQKKKSPGTGLIPKIQWNPSFDAFVCESCRLLVVLLQWRQRMRETLCLRPHSFISPLQYIFNSLDFRSSLDQEFTTAIKKIQLRVVSFSSYQFRYPGLCFGHILFDFGAHFWSMVTLVRFCPIGNRSFLIRAQLF